MQLLEASVRFVLVFIAIVIIGVILKKRDIIPKDSSSVISQLVMQLVYPALIFSTVATANLYYEEVLAAIAFDIALLSVGCVSYLIARFILQLARTSLAATVLASMFSATTLIGTAMLKIVFEGHPEDVTIGIVVSQLSNSLLLNSLGIFIGAHFGSSSNTGLRAQLQEFLFSRPLVALILGLIWSLCDLPTTGFLAEAVIGTLNIIGSAMPLLAALVTGLSLKVPKIKGLVPAIVLVATGQLIVEPLLFHWWAKTFGDPLIYREIGVLMCSLGSSPVIVVICNRYRCNTELASVLVVSSTALSAVTLPIAAYFLSAS